MKKIILTCSFVLLLFLSISARAISLQEYAQQHPLKIYTVTKGAVLPLGKDAFNNLGEGDKVLLLSGKDLTSIAGISKLTADDNGQVVPLASVKGLQIFLNDNQIEVVPAEMGDLKNVTFLYFNHNRISALPAEMHRMSSLQGIYFSNNRFTEIPSVVFTLVDLRKLQFSENQIKEMPSEIGNLTQLIHFNMAGNQIAVLPDSMGKLTLLRVCDLSDNHLHRLPDSFGQVKIKYQLRVRNNPLTALPAGFGEMPGTIDITGTQIDPNTLSPALRARISAAKHSTKPSLVKITPARPN